MNVKQLLPKEQRELIITALKSYQATIGEAIERHESRYINLGDVLNHDMFDITGLIGMMKYDVEIALPKVSKAQFAAIHGVDFPEYCDVVKRKYPIVDEGMWVTIITGTMSFTDDGIHARSVVISEILTAERHLRCDMGEVLDTIENDGHDYLVVEDYDGHMEMDLNPAPKVEDKREFLVVDVCGRDNYTQTYEELERTDTSFLDEIDALEVNETVVRHKDEVYIIRIK